MSKLPIFVEYSSLQLIRDGRVQLGIIGEARQYEDTIGLYSTERAGMVRYEPAVSRCKTCPSFSLISGSFGHCSQWEAPDTPYNAPDDGSGYCHLHPDAKP